MCIRDSGWWARRGRPCACAARARGERAGNRAIRVIVGVLIGALIKAIIGAIIVRQSLGHSLGQCFCLLEHGEHAATIGALIRALIKAIIWGNHRLLEHGEDAAADLVDDPGEERHDDERRLRWRAREAWAR
eukprot:3542835-Prymnesium_polylepis.1